MGLLTRRLVRGAFAVAALTRAAPAKRRAGGSGHHDRRSSARARAIGGSPRGRGRERRPGRPRLGRRGHPDASTGWIVQRAKKCAGGGSTRRGSAGRARRPTAPRDAGRLARSQSLSIRRSRRPCVRSRCARCLRVREYDGARTNLRRTRVRSAAPTSETRNLPPSPPTSAMKNESDARIVYPRRGAIRVRCRTRVFRREPLSNARDSGETKADPRSNSRDHGQRLIIPRSRKTNDNVRENQNQRHTGAGGWSG